MSSKIKSVLVLENGTYFPGEGFGQTGETIGEVVFDTSMTGYQEITTDPSYRGQIVAMTYPLIGNYGFNNTDIESDRAHIQGFIVKELCNAPSNWRSVTGYDEYFKKNNVIGIKGIDTRALTQHLRNNGSMYGIISTECGNIDILQEKLKSEKKKPRNLVMEVTAREPIHRPSGGFGSKPDSRLNSVLGRRLCNGSGSRLDSGPDSGLDSVSGNKPEGMSGGIWCNKPDGVTGSVSCSSKKVVVLDFGVKMSIIRALETRNYDIYILPATSSYEDIVSYSPDGILLSNGPGNPESLPEAIGLIKRLSGIKPMLGIGLGHQLLGLALGGSTYKLKFGHHGANHPVKDFRTGRCYITLQNHNYALASEFDADVEISQINVNDNTVEGFRHKHLPLLGVQYYPEAAAVTQDTAYIFDDFLKMM